MLFGQSMKKVLSARGYHHCKSDEEFTRHGDYARNMQYAFSKEHKSGRSKIIDIVFLSADLLNEKLVIGFYRENVSIENGVLVNSDTSIPLSKFSIKAFEKQLDRLIPARNPARTSERRGDKF
jgi:hypothetical protein